MNIQPFDHNIAITKVSKYSYQIFTTWSKDSVDTTAHGLLNLAAWVEQNRTQLEQEKAGLEAAVSEDEGYLNPTSGYPETEPVRFEREHFTSIYGRAMEPEDER